jgi:single-strand DNA-binding protein
MASLNNCCFIGNVGKIETRHLTSGDTVVNLSLACNESYKDKNGEKQEKTEWVNVTIYGKLGEVATKYVEKGKQLYISGRMSTRKWKDKNGIDRYTTEIIATDMKLLGGLSKDDSNRRAEQPRNQKESFSDDTDIPF